MKSFLFNFLLILLIGIGNSSILAQTTVEIGSGSSSSASRGPIQVAGGTSTTVATAFNQVYTATELAAAGLTAGAVINELRWELNSTNVIQGAGNASFKIYMKNSSATSATADTWENTISGSALVLDRTFNTTDNFPGATGYMPFPLTSSFSYTGGAIEIAVLWDMSGITADPAGGTQAFNNPDGASDPGSIKWRYSTTTGTNLVSKKTTSSSISSSSSLTLANQERANIEIVYVPSSVTTTLGTSTSSSASRGPIQVPGGTSTTTITAFNQVYTAAELAAAGLVDGNTITELQWELNSTNVIQGAGNASFQIYMRNSSATSATADTWGNTISGSTLVLDRTFNTTDNFPGATGYMAFPLTTSFDYTGGALEIAVLWDMSGVTADPAGGTQAFNNPDGASDPGTIKWRYSATTGTNLVSKKTGSSAITSGSSLTLANEERANMQIVYTTTSSTTTIGSGSSSSASRGPIQVPGGTSTTVATAFNQVYTATELAAAGISSGDFITELQWDLQSTNVIQGAGDAFFKIYLKNSSATSATADTWGNTIDGAVLVVDRTFNTTDNFPGVKGFMAFPLTNPFNYTGGALEIAVHWDMSGITADPAGGTQAFNNPDGSSDPGNIKWRYSATTGTNLGF